MVQNSNHKINSSDHSIWKLRNIASTSFQSLLNEFYFVEHATYCLLQPIKEDFPFSTVFSLCHITTPLTSKASAHSYTPYIYTAKHQHSTILPATLWGFPTLGSRQNLIGVFLRNWLTSQHKYLYDGRNFAVVAATKTHYCSIQHSMQYNLSFRVAQGRKLRDRFHFIDFSAQSLTAMNDFVIKPKNQFCRIYYCSYTQLKHNASSRKPQTQVAHSVGLGIEQPAV